MGDGMWRLSKIEASSRNDGAQLDCRIIRKYPCIVVDNFSLQGALQRMLLFRHQCARLQPKRGS